MSEIRITRGKRKILSSSSEEDSADEVKQKIVKPKEKVRRQQNALHPPNKRIKQDPDEEPVLTKPIDSAQVITKFPVKQEDHKENLSGNSVSKHDDSDSDSASDEEDGLSAFERRRLANIQANREFLAQINMQEALLDLGEVTGPQRKTEKNSSSNNQRKFKKREPPPARRPRSLRLQRKDPDGAQLPDIPVIPAEPVNEHPRKPAGVLGVAEVAIDDGDVESFGSLKSLSELDIWTCPDQVDDKYEQVTRSLCKLRLREDHVTKVVQNRVFSLALHPNTERLLAVAGDKWGQVGFWEIGCSRTDRGVCVYTPHSRPVNCLRFSSQHPDKLYSCSYDGSVRCCHFLAGEFQELYRTSDEEEERCIAFDFLSPDTLLIARSDGHVIRVDERESCSCAEEFQVLDKTVKCVSVHPQKTNYFITADNGGSVNFFDLRQSRKKLSSSQCLSHGRSVNSAYFSPVTGQYILTTAMDDTVRIYDSTDLSKISIKHKIRHDNHTGRWLTGFRAAWHPAREDVFVVGSMSRPRQIDLYNSSGQKIHAFQDLETLSSVCSINVLHPTIPALVGANSSGKLHAFT